MQYPIFQVEKNHDLCSTKANNPLLRSKFICIYNVEQTVLLKRFEVSRNLSYDGMLQFLRSDNMTDQGKGASFSFLI